MADDPKFPFLPSAPPAPEGTPPPHIGELGSVANAPPPLIDQPGLSPDEMRRWRHGAAAVDDASTICSSCRNVWVLRCSAPVRSAGGELGLIEQYCQLLSGELFDLGERVVYRCSRFSSMPVAEGEGETVEDDKNEDKEDT